MLPQRGGVLTPQFDPKRRPWQRRAAQIPLLIHDTDADVDNDDVADLAYAVGLHLAGKVQLIGVTYNSSNAFGPAAVRALLDYNGLWDVPVYAYTTTTPGQGNGTWNGVALLNFGRYCYNRLDAPPSKAGLRTMLANAPRPVVITMNGYGNAIAELLQSPADSISPLTGAQLVAAKVSACYWSCGWMPSNTAPQDGSGSHGPDFNITGDIASAQYVAANWPSSVPFYWCGNEMAGGIMTEMPAATDQAVSPWAMAFWSQAHPRFSWARPIYDLAAGDRSGFVPTGVNGQVAIDASGNDTWTSGGGTQQYLTGNVSALSSTLAAKWDAGMVQSTQSAGRVAPLAADPSSWCTAWWQPSDAASVTVSGANVTQVADKTGHGYALTVPADTTIGPTITANALNGLQVLSFDGASQMLACDGLAAAVNAAQGVPFYWAMLVELTRLSQEQHLFDIGPNAGVTTHYQNRIIGITNSSAKFQAARVKSTISKNYPQPGVTLSTSAYALVEHFYDPTRVSTDISFNGRSLVAVNNTSPASGGDSDDNQTLTLTTCRVMGSTFSTDQSSNHYYAQGNLAEAVFALGRLPNPAQRTGWLRYLKARYALTTLVNV